MSRKVFVTNIPVRTCVDGWVIVPDDTKSDHLNESIRDSLIKSSMDGAGLHDGCAVLHSGLDLDLSLIDKWEFSTPLEAR